jgi:hypothetical protein
MSTFSGELHYVAYPKMEGKEIDSSCLGKDKCTLAV